jgi:hypothetical protein
MGPEWPNATVAPDECSWLDTTWRQDAERGGGEDPGDRDLDPEGGCSYEEYPCSPLIFDLNGDGLFTTRFEDGPVSFDLSADGTVDLTAWTNPVTEEGILYFDHNHNGRIDGGNELFGDATFLENDERARHGFEALAAYDRAASGGNGDGVISPGDAVWGKLRLWIDRSHDALMTSDENYTLGAASILSISLTYMDWSRTPHLVTDTSGNRHLLQGTFLMRSRNGKKVTRAVHDVYFRADIR